MSKPVFTPEAVRRFETAVGAHHVSPIRVSETLTILTRLEKDEMEDIQAIDRLIAKLQTMRTLMPLQFRLQTDSAIDDLVSFRQSEASELSRLREISRLMTGQD